MESFRVEVNYGSTARLERARKGDRTQIPHSDTSYLEKFSCFIWQPSDELNPAIHLANHRVFLFCQKYTGENQVDDKGMGKGEKWTNVSQEKKMG